ncbi:hypothetical protein VaNZ11_014373 [Volvox africanus]|uniref:Uncharacterized protein n=1 Tax=Volvox africanus TaxID=51714 RepID=A0ABQ5SIG3_9CHLO|nr:hypothetical protein VaNZ11_014373 [Volvox africanus]
MLIFAGSYERFIFGYSASDDCSQPQEVVKRYTFAAHKSAVKCLAAAGPYVASGGADDLIHMYDMKAERDLGILLNPCDGAVPCLEFFMPESRSAPSHMLSGSADGAINIWRCKDWEHLKVMRGHKASVNSLAVHRSGRLALSVARDKAIRMWNLSKGRTSYTAPLESEADWVGFLQSGEAYSLISSNRITVHSTSGALLAAYSAPRRILCCASQDDSLVLLGLEDGSVRVWDVRTSGVVGGWERAHTNRVRGMAILQAGSGKLPAYLATASSDGAIKLWDTRRLGGPAGAAPEAAPAVCTAQVSTNARLTCLVAVDPDAGALQRGSKPPTKAAAEGEAPPAKKQKKDVTSGDASGRQEDWVRAATSAKVQTAAAPAVKQVGTKPAVERKPHKSEQQQEQQQQQQQQQQQPKVRCGSKVSGRGQQGGRDHFRLDDPGFEVVPADSDGDDGDGEKEDKEAEEEVNGNGTVDFDDGGSSSANDGDSDGAATEEELEEAPRSVLPSLDRAQIWGKQRSREGGEEGGQRGYRGRGGGVGKSGQKQQLLLQKQKRPQQPSSQAVVCEKAPKGGQGRKGQQRGVKKPNGGHGRQADRGGSMQNPLGAGPTKADGVRGGVGRHKKQSG